MIFGKSPITAYLKQETKKYVPMFLAAMTIAKEPQKYGFSNIEYHPPLVYEKVAGSPFHQLGPDCQGRGNGSL